MIEVKIDKEVSEYIEKLFYEQNAIKNVLDLLIEKKGNPDAINQQIERYSQTYTELEQAKRVAANKCAPKPMTELSCYNFNFNNHSIEFYELNEK